MAVVYFVIVVPYKHVQARRGQDAFGDPAPVKTCPECLSSDLPAAASSASTAAPTQPAVTGRPEPGCARGPPGAGRLTWRRRNC